MLASASARRSRDAFWIREMVLSSRLDLENVRLLEKVFMQAHSGSMYLDAPNYLSSFSSVYGQLGLEGPTILQILKKAFSVFEITYPYLLHTIRIICLRKMFSL